MPNTRFIDTRELRWTLLGEIIRTAWQFGIQ
jgi:hypothetical protein